MTGNDEEKGPEKPDTPGKMPGQIEGRPQPDAESESAANNSRGAKLRELLQRRQAAKATSAQQAGAGVSTAGNTPPVASAGEVLQRRPAVNTGTAPRAGGGMLLRALAQSAGEGAGGNNPNRGALLRMALANRTRNDPAGAAGTDDEQALGAGPAGQGARIGNRGMLLRQIIQARRNRAVGQPNNDAQELLELQNRVQQLTEEVERLRANQAEQAPAAKRAPGAAGTQKQAGIGRRTLGRKTPQPGKHKA